MREYREKQNNNNMASSSGETKQSECRRTAAESKRLRWITYCIIIWQRRRCVLLRGERPCATPRTTLEMHLLNGNIERPNETAAQHHNLNCKKRKKGKKKSNELNLLAQTFRCVCSVCSRHPKHVPVHSAEENNNNIFETTKIMQSILFVEEEKREKKYNRKNYICDRNTCLMASICTAKS